jgi:hypothetical protein
MMMLTKPVNYRWDKESSDNNYLLEIIKVKKLLIDIQEEVQCRTL